MTLEQILDCDADKLEKMSDTELLEHFRPFLCVTRPEQSNPNREKKVYKQDTLKGYGESADYKIKMNAARELAAKFGVKI